MELVAFLALVPALGLTALLGHVLTPRRSAMWYYVHPSEPHEPSWYIMAPVFVLTWVLLTLLGATAWDHLFGL